MYHNTVNVNITMHVFRHYNKTLKHMITTNVVMGMVIHGLSTVILSYTAVYHSLLYTHLAL